MLQLKDLLHSSCLIFCILSFSDLHAQFSKLHPPTYNKESEIENEDKDRENITQSILVGTLLTDTNFNNEGTCEADQRLYFSFFYGTIQRALMTGNTENFLHVLDDLFSHPDFFNSLGGDDASPIQRALAPRFLEEENISIIKILKGILTNRFLETFNSLNANRMLENTLALNENHITPAMLTMIHLVLPKNRDVNFKIH